MRIYTVKAEWMIISVITLFAVFGKESSQVSADCILHDKTQQQKDNLEKLALLSGEKLTVKSKDSTYKIGICVKPDTDEKNPNSSVVKNTNEKTYVLGRFTSTEILAGYNWVMLTYYNGDNTTEGQICQRMAHIMIVCDPSNEVSDVRVISDQLDQMTPHCFTSFEIRSKYVCEKSTLSSGSVFCILFFTGLGLYLLLGFCYQRLVIGAQGMEQIPNFAFWKDFGNLQADGCDFVCRCGSRKEANSYRGIDEHLPRTEERDDQMLTM